MTEYSDRRTRFALDSYARLFERAREQQLDPGTLYLVAALIVEELTVEHDQFGPVCETIAKMASSIRAEATKGVFSEVDAIDALASAADKEKRL